MRSTAMLGSLALAFSACLGCGSDDPLPATSEPDAEINGQTSTEASTSIAAIEAFDAQRFPDVLDADAEQTGDTWTITATLSSPYDSPDRYADAWRVVGADATVYGERILTHDHAQEQPFTRALPGIEIPDDVTEVVIEGRDLQHGYGGTTFTLILPR